MIRKRRIIAIPVLIGFFFLLDYFILYVQYSTVSLGRNVSAHLVLKLWRESDEGTSNYLIETKKCKIPKMHIMPKFYAQNWHSEKFPDCDYETKLHKVHNDEILEMFYPYENGQCCLYSINREPNNDNSFKSSDCIKIVSKFTKIKGVESFILKCDSHVNMEINIVVRTEVQNKIKALEHKIKSKDKLKYFGFKRPLNIILIGIDSVSRSHAYRSLPKAISFMRKLGFVDFKGFHSVAPSTLTNYMAFLMGLTRPEVRSGCAPNWISSFNNCSFIWGNFSEENYVTSYVEDGHQSFNWGEQSGFSTDKPTDYYFHPVFTALEKFRKQDLRSRINQDKYANCASSVTIPQYMLLYMSRFFKKFQHHPFFSFTWLEDPFHDYPFSLANVDEDLLSFFQRLNTTRDILENSVIIFLSDHGDRNSFFHSNSPESFIERGLPPLFIRLPQVLRQKYPQMQESLLFNSKQLTTPFDVHHTLLHILSLSFPQSTKYKSFSPQKPDRSSLLVKVPEGRTCESTNIPRANCLCNVYYEISNNNTKTFDNSVPKILANKLVSFALKQLNLKIQNSEYKKLCESWYLNEILYVRKIGDVENYSLMLLAFEVSPGEARFESRVKVRKGLLPREVQIEYMELVGFSRISKYGDTSWCVKTKTDLDKELKEMCMCKTRARG